MTRKDVRTDPQLKLRLPAALKSKLDAAAEALHRPVGNEIIARLEASFAEEDARSKQAMQNVIDFDLGTTGEPSTAARVGRLEKRSDEQEKQIAALKREIAKLTRA